MAITIDGKEFAQGLVLAIDVTNRYDSMSDYDWYKKRALYFDPIKNAPVWEEIDSSWNTPNFSGKNTATVDADQSTKDAYLDYLTEKLYTDLFWKEQEANDQIVKGCQVEVVKGRNVPKGTKGKVICTLWRKYGMGWHAKDELKLGVATSDVMIDVVKDGKTYKNHKDVTWVWARNCKRTDGAPVDKDAIQARAKAYAIEQFKKICKAT
jgi:hypothetical protein